MPQPTQTASHVDKILTGISVAYIQDDDSFIADKVFPTVPVEKQSDKYFVYRKNDWFRDEAQRRADATESAGSGYNLDTDTYNADVWAFHKDVGQQTLQNSDAPLSPLSDAAQFVTQRLKLRQERQFVTDYFGTGIWGTDVVGTAGTPGANQVRKWSDYSQGFTYDPIDDIEGGKETVLSTTGYLPNTLVIGWRVARKLKSHPVIRDRTKYVQGGNVTNEMLAAAFGVDRLLIAKAVTATNAEGTPAGYQFVYPDSALLAYVNPAPALLKPSAGYCMAWKGVSQGLGETVGISQIDMPLLKATRVEGEVAFDNKVVATDMAVFYSQVI